MNKRIGNISLFIIAYSLFGYPINASIALILGLNPQILNWIFRLLILFLSLYLLSIFLVGSTNNTVTHSFVLLILFFIIYSIRFIWDIGVRGIGYGSKPGLQSFIFFVGTCIVPAISVGLSFKYIDKKKIYSYLFVVLILSNILIIISILITGQQIGEGRVSLLTKDGSYLVNPITVSFIGGNLVMIVMARLLLLKQNTSFGKYIIYLLFIVPIGILNLFMGASRGPFIITIFLSIIILTLYLKSIKCTIKKCLSIGIGIAFIYIFLHSVIIKTIQDKNILILSRIESFLTARNKGLLEERDLLFIGSLKQFLESPIIGDKIIESSLSYYPHNILLEALMATGIVGSIFLFSVLTSSFLKVFKGINGKNELLIVYLIFINVFLMGMISAGIGISNDFWISITTIASISKTYINT